VLGKAHNETQATQVYVIHTFECVSASWEVGQGSTVLRLLSPAQRSVPERVLPSNVENGRTDYRIRPTVRKYVGMAELIALSSESDSDEEIITSACQFLHRNLTLNLERWVQPFLTSQDYKKVLLIVRSHCHAVFPVLRLPVLRPLESQYALTLCHAVFPVLSLPALRPPTSQCAPGLSFVKIRAKQVML
jgi:hypothetical protein